MPYCSNCGSSVQKAEKFCSSCGQAIESPFPAVVPPGGKKHPVVPKRSMGSNYIMIALVVIIFAGLVMIAFNLVDIPGKEDEKPGSWEETGNARDEETVVDIPEGAIVVPRDYQSIQEAINEAFNGQTIVVLEGIYYENIDFLGKAITLRSADPGDPEVVGNTRIHGEDKGSVVSFHSGEGAVSIIEGFTITGGSGTLLHFRVSYEGKMLEFERVYGGGILVTDGSSPTIRNNVISNNRLSAVSADIVGVGAGIAILNGSSPLIEYNDIHNNYSEGHGAGIAVWYRSSPTIRNNHIAYNQADDIAGGVLISMECSPYLEHNEIYNNTATSSGGIYIAYRSSPRVIQNNIQDNNASWGSGIMVWSTPAAYIERNYFSGNRARQDGGGIYVGNSAFPTVTGNHFENNSALGNGGAVWIDRDSNIYLNSPDDNTYSGNTPDQIYRR